MRQTPFHFLGRFVVTFQRLESSLNTILVSLSCAPDEAARIMINELSFAQRLKTASTLMGWFVAQNPRFPESLQKEFDEHIAALQKAAERRNELVHSDFTHLPTTGVDLGLVREKSRLRPSRGEREVYEEELLDEVLEQETQALMNLEAKFRQFPDWVAYWRSHA